MVKDVVLRGRVRPCHPIGHGRVDLVDARARDDVQLYIDPRVLGEEAVVAEVLARSVREAP